MAAKDKVVLSVRVNKRNMATWKAYNTASGLSMPSLITEAITEYINNHPLTGYRQNIFKERTRNMKMTVREWLTEEAEKQYNFQIENYQDGYVLPEHEIQEYINYLVDLSCDEWDGTDDPGDDENDRLRFQVIDWLERRMEKDVPEMIERHQWENE